MELLSLSEAAGRVCSLDSLGIPLGPGQPGAFLHALGEREAFEDLQVFGALLVDPFALFTRRGVSLRSRFFGPVDRVNSEAATAQVAGKTTSRIVNLMPADTYVTTPRHDVDVTITEHGAAELRGRTVAERAEALIEIAAPEFRESLREVFEQRKPRAARKR